MGLTILIFVALIINLCTLGAYIIGIKLDIENKDCKDEIQAVKNNKLAIKLIQLFNVIVFIILFISIIYE